MKIKNIPVRLSNIAIAVFLVFTILLIVTFLITWQWQLLVWGLPTLVMLLLLPLGLNYMSQHQYADLAPIYEAKARPVKVRHITLKLIGEPVRIEGIVERTYFQFLNRPQFLVADRTGEISVKMFTNPTEEIQKGDAVEVYGQVIRRYVMAGDAVINCVVIRKLPSKAAGKNGGKEA